MSTREESLAVGNRMMGPAPGEESCGCGPTATWGLADAADPRYLGGFVDKQGWRHDPLRHTDNCPRLQEGEPTERCPTCGGAGVQAGEHRLDLALIKVAYSHDSECSPALRHAARAALGLAACEPRQDCKACENADGDVA